MNRKELKQAARLRLRESRPAAWKVTLLYLLLASAIPTAAQMLSQDPFQLYLQYTTQGYSPDIAISYAFSGPWISLSIFLSILITLYTMVINFGFNAWCLTRARDGEAGFGTLISGFGMAGRVIGLNLFIALFTFLWSLAVMIPAALLITAALALSMGPAGYFSGGSAALAVVAVVVIYAAAIIVLIAILLRYAMSCYALLDHPEEGIRAAVRRSKQLMDGKRWSYVVLQLSFLGWYLLLALIVAAAAVVSALLLIGLSMAQGWQIWAMVAGTPVFLVLSFLLPLPLECWLVPYVGLTDAGFYLERTQAPRMLEHRESFPVL
jgi:uncharacterized membrane protein